MSEPKLNMERIFQENEEQLLQAFKALEKRWIIDCPCGAAFAPEFLEAKVSVTGLEWVILCPDCLMEYGVEDILKGAQGTGRWGYV